jgi:hypothetical protein
VGRDLRAWGAASGWRGDHAELLGQSLVDNEETMSVTSTTLLVNRFFGSHHSKLPVIVSKKKKLPVIHLSYVGAQNLLCFFRKFYGQRADIAAAIVGSRPQ